MLDYRFVDGTRLTAVIEALIFSTPEPIPWEKVSEIIHESEEELELDENTITTIVNQLNERYEQNDLSFRIEETGGGYTFTTKPRYHPWLSIFQHENAYRNSRNQLLKPWQLWRIDSRSQNRKSIRYEG